MEGHAREAVDADAVLQSILTIRGQRVLVDSVLASLYQVQTKALTRAVRRNIDRFPEDFMFRLVAEEIDSLRRQPEPKRRGIGFTAKIDD